MAKSLRLGSKLLVALVLLSAVSADCLSEITHSGSVCDILNAFTSYTGKTEFCNSPGTDINNLLEYCKIAPCNTCDATLGGCVSMINQNDDQILAKVYTSVGGDPQVTPFEGLCIVTVGEDCYRNSIQDENYLQRYQDTADAVTASTDKCCLFECYDSFALSEGGCGTDGAFYTSINTFCQKYCGDRSLSLTNCGQVGCGIAQGCPDPCLAETLDPPFCSNTFVFYDNKTTYCTDRNNGLVTGTIACNPNCSQKGCDYLNCLDVTVDYPLGSICLENKLDGKNFYDSLTSYCTAKVDKAETNYQIVNYVDCAATSCQSSTACCNRLCNKESYIKGCDPVTFTVVEQTEYCSFRCSNNGVDKVMDTCSTSGTPSDCQDCNYFACKNAIGTVAGFTTVCGKGSGADDVFYTNVDDYCNANLTDYSTSYILCAGNVPCGSDPACCYANCIENNKTGYVGKCNTTDYVFHDTVEKYCSSFCPTRSYTPYFSAPSVLASATQCCNTKCNADASNQPLCNATTFALTSVVDQCSNTCSSGPNTYLPCDGLCDDNKCKKLACLNGLKDYAEDQDVCASDNTFYTDKNAFCNAYLLNNLLTETKCGTGACSTPEACCQANCEIAEKNTFTTTCDTNNNTYVNYVGYCEAKCLDKTFVQSVCEGARCNETQCCEKKCVSNDNPLVCSLSFNLLTEEAFCSAKCADPSFTGLTCDGNCSDKECEKKKCLDAISGSASTICVSTAFKPNVFFYESKGAYCNDKYDLGSQDYSTTNFLTCPGGLCTSNTCIEARCLLETIYTTCDSSANPITKSSFCNYRGLNSGTNMTVTGCTDAKGDPIDCPNCNIIQCNLDLENVYDTPETVCANNYTFYNTKPEYCNAKENDASIEYVLCPGNLPCGSDYDCCLNVCDVKNSAGYADKCNTTEYAFDDTVDKYCISFCKDLRKTYTPYMIGGVLATEKECAIQRCIVVDGKKQACKISDYSLITALDYCTLESNGTPPDIFQCNTGCTQPDCDFQKCLNVTFSDHKNDADVCGSNNTFYDNMSDFCVDFIADTTGTLQLVLCGGSACATATDCCEQNCIHDHSNNFAPTCDGKFNYYETVASYCEAKCAPGFVEKLCAGVLCTETQCCNDECKSQPFFSTCIPSITNILYTDQSLFCTSYCTVPGNKPNYDNCDTGCIQSDCDIKRCVFTSPSNNCGSNGIFYTDSTEYCTQKVTNGITEVTCSGGACAGQSECCLQDCSNDNPVANFVPRCDTAFTELDTSSEYCGTYCANTPLVDINLYCDANKTVLCTLSECCVKECEAKPYTPVCSPTFGLLTKNAYCVASCADPSYKPVTCTGDCDQKKCDILKCLDVNSAYNQSTVCLNAAYNGKNFFLTLLSYCESNVNGANTNYPVPSYQTCSPTSCSETECCNKRCELEDFKDSCSSDFKIVTESEYCTYRCAHNGTNMNVDRCFDANNVQINCADCTTPQCLTDINDRYLTPSTVCSNKDVFYATKEEYCDAKALDNTINLQLCSGNTPCATTGDCCGANCLVREATSYTAKCNTTDYVYHNTVEKYCSSYCPAKQYTIYKVSTVNATEKECCKAACLLKNDKVDSCNASSFDFVTKDQQCEAECNGSLDTYVKCDGGACTQQACDIRKCAKNLTDYDDTRDVCGTDGVNYTDKTAYCTEKNTNNSSLSIRDCGGSICASPDDCCLYNCIANKSAGFYPTCDTSFNLYLDINSYCTAFCQPGFTQNICGSKPCTRKECCTQDCNDDPFNALCIPSLNATLYDNQAGYCDVKCADPANPPSIKNCDTDCAAKDCNIFRCEFTQPDTAYCGSNGKYYATDTLFCTDVASEPSITSITCGGSICADDKACCIENCHINNPEATYQPRCDIDFNYLETRNDYCNSYCSNLATYKNLYCDVDKTVFCTKKECCNQGCNGSPYTAVCDSNYDLMNQTGYCTSYCDNKDFPNYTCAGGCDDTKCSGLECQAALGNYTYTSVCHVADIGGQNYFSTLTAYCDAKILAKETDYSLTTTEYYTCDGGQCLTPASCCKAECLVSQTKTGCTAAGVLINPSDYCDNQCAGNTNYDLQYCGNNDCPNCDVADCFADNSTYTLTKVCLRDELDSQIFYANLFSYCSKKVELEETDYSLTAKFNSCADTTCGDTESCCNANCNQGTYLSLCNPDDKSVVNQQAFCTLNCKKQAGFLKQCQNSSGTQIACTPDYCTNYDCITSFRAANYPYESICLASELETNKFLYDTLINYCKAKTTLGITDNTVPVYKSCGSEAVPAACTDDRSCCRARCAAENYQTSCSSTAQLIDKTEYCRNKCEDATPYVLSTCVGACNNCDFVKCPLDIAGYNYTSVCLKSALGLQNYFASKSAYCDAMISISKKDFFLEPVEYYLCENSSCDANGCCNNVCLAKTYTAVCDSTSFALLTQASYCDNTCKNSTNTGVKCFDADGEQVNCTTTDCCASELANASFPACSSSGQVFADATSYCTAKASNATLTIVSTSSITFPVCGSDYSLYADISAYCTAVAANTKLTSIDVCGDSTCNEAICCLARCPTVPNNPVVILAKTGNLFSFKNECYGNCAITDGNIVKTCTTLSQNECKATYCEESEFCGSKTSESYYSYVCAEDGAVYDNECRADCNNQPVIDDCPKKCSDDSWRLKRCRYECQMSFNEL